MDLMERYVKPIRLQASPNGRTEIAVNGKDLASDGQC